jgi:ferric-dicitrate binding protein FerR (iron transport regulator)
MEDRIYILIAKVLQGEASDAERHELDAWLTEDPKHRAELAEMQASWKEADSLFEKPQFNATAAWDKVATRIHQPVVEEAPKRSRTIAFPAWTKYSSAIAAMLVIAVLLWNPFKQDTIQIAAADQDQRIELPDHSIITLHKGSSFSYPKKFASNERHVKLEGEAYFEVTRNEAQPFIIDAQSVNVKVLGTTFNVRCNENIADVTVTSGRVQVTSQKDGSKAVILTPGRKAHYESGQVTESASEGHETFWKTNELSFKDEPLSEVIKVISSLKDTSIQLDSRLTAAQQAQAVTATFRNQNLEDMLTELCLISNCKWQKQGATYLVGPK